MAKGGFVVNWDGQQQRCSELSVDFDKHRITVHGKEGGQSGEIKDWSTFSVHAITKKDIKEALGEVEVEEVKKDG